MSTSKLLLGMIAATALTCVVTAQNFSPGYYNLSGGGPTRLQVDLNRDGIPDILTNNISYGTEALVSDASTGKFTTHPYSFRDSSPTYAPVAAGDFNGDSNADVIFYNYTGGSQLFYLAYGDGKGNFSSIVPIPNLPNIVTGTQYYVLAQAADFNSDHRADLAFAYIAPTGNSYTVYVVLYLNNGNGFSNAGTIFTYPNPSGATSVLNDQTPALDFLIGDFNAEGHADLALRILHSTPSNPVQQDANLFVLYGDGKGHFAQKAIFTGRVSDDIFSAADMNDDGRTDLICVDGLDNSAHIFYGAPSRTFKEKILSSAVTRRNILWFPPQIADFDGNGLKDVAFVAQEPHTDAPNYGVTVLHQTSLGAFVIGQYSDIDTFTTYSGWNPFYGLSLGDYNRDGKADVAAFTTTDANSHPNSAALMLNQAGTPVGHCPPAFGIHVCSSTSTATNPVSFSFSSTALYPLRKMEIWVDNVKRSETYHVFGQQGFSDVSLNLTPGVRKIDLFAVPFDGVTVTKRTYYLTVQ